VTAALAGFARSPQAETVAAAPAPTIHFVDREAALSLRYPRGWHRPARLTKIIYPRERLALASHPLPRNDTIGECQAQHSLERMPPDGVFIYLLEFRPPRGKVWAEIRRRDFRPRPKPFRITHRSPQRNVGCYQGRSYALMFRDADRPFRLFVAFGDKVSSTRIAQAQAVLNSLRFRPPPPPPDPYAGWALLTTESGDSLRPPPGWPASATFMPRSLPRPRPLFFTSNMPLPGLPAKLVSTVKQLPTPFPTQALDAFPATAVLLWVLEEPKGGPSAAFPAMIRHWPAGAFQPARNGPAMQWPTLAWLRAGGSFRGYRFSVWIVSGPDASQSDRALAPKSAASLALSGCLRDNTTHCPEGP
jgi:hypothetical protein